MQNICILGATGSIGQSTIDVVLRHPDLYQVYALTAHSQIDKLLEQAKLCQPKYLVLSNGASYQHAKQALLASGIKTELLSGAQALADVASAHEVDVVMAAIVGGAGLLPTIAAVKAGKKVLLANKESLVMSGELFINAAKNMAQRYCLLTVNTTLYFSVCLMIINTVIWRPVGSTVSC